MAKSKPFRCLNPLCSTDPLTGRRVAFDFWSEKAVCPRCGVEMKKMPQVVIPLEVHHFDPPTVVPGVHHRLLACTGKLAGGAMMTGDPNSVNCPECKTTEAYKKAADEWGVPVIDEDGEQQFQAILEKVAAAPEGT